MYRWELTAQSTRWGLCVIREAIFVIGMSTSFSVVVGGVVVGSVVGDGKVSRRGAADVFADAEADDESDIESEVREEEWEEPRMSSMDEKSAKNTTVTMTIAASSRDVRR